MQQGSGRLVFYAFDLLEADGEPLVELPLEERRERLAALLDRRSGLVRLSDGFDDGAALLAGRRGAGSRGNRGQAARLAVRAGPPDAGLAEAEDARPPGVRRSPATRAARAAGRGTFGSLVLAVNEGGGAPLRRQRRDRASTTARSSGCSGCCARSSAPSRRSRSAEDAARPPRRRHLGRAAARRRGRVQRVDARRPRPPAVLQGAPRRQAGRGGAPRAAGRGRRPQGQARAAAVEPRQALLARRGDHEGRPRRLLPPVAPVLVPHLRNRPFTMRRYPDGAGGKAFFQKDAPSHMPDWIPRYRALVSTRSCGRAKKQVEFPLVNDELALLWMANMGCIDMNAVVLADRPAGPARLRALRPRPDARGAVVADDRGRAARQGAPRRPRARVVPEDLGRQGLPRARAARPPVDLRRLACVRRARRRDDRRAPIRGSRRRSGRRRAAAAC